jgi:hypothetical protein
LEILGNEMRAHASLYPCYRPEHALDPTYYHMVALKYHCSVTLDVWKKPNEWHGSVCVLHEIGSGTDETFGTPEQAILATFQWPAEEKKIAREILGYLLGPVILTKTQIVREIDDKYSKHWFTAARSFDLLKGQTHGPN